MCVCVCGCSVCVQSCLNLWDPLNCSPAGFFVLLIFQARILEWVVISSSSVSAWSRDQIGISCVSCIAGRFFTHWSIWEENPKFWGVWNPGCFWETRRRLKWKSQQSPEHDIVYMSYSTCSFLGLLLCLCMNGFCYMTILAWHGCYLQFILLPFIWIFFQVENFFWSPTVWIRPYHTIWDICFQFNFFQQPPPLISATQIRWEAGECAAYIEHSK